MAARLECGGSDLSCGLGNISVGHDNVGSVGAKLGDELLVTGGSDQCFAGLRATREADGANIGMRDERDRRVLVAGNGVEKPPREPGIDEEARERERRSRSSGRRLDDYRISRGNRWPDLLDEKIDRSVEGCDRADDAIGYAPREAEMAGPQRRGIDRHHFTGKVEHGGGAGFEKFRAAFQFKSRCSDRFADILT